MAHELKIGVIGGGMVSQIAHLPFYLRDSRCEVVAVAESRPSLVKHLRDVLGIANVVSDHRQLLDDHSISAVVIVAPRAANGPLTLEALEAGKDVIVEKPMAHTTAQAGRLIDAAAGRNRILGVTFMKRYDPGVQAAFQKLKQLRVSGELGNMLLVRFYDYAHDYAHPPPPHKRPEESRPIRYMTWATAPDWLPLNFAGEYGSFMNTASHDINLMRYFFPRDLRLTHASATGNGTMVATFEHADMPIVFELAKSAGGPWLQGAEFVFQKGRMLLEVASPMSRNQPSQVTIDKGVGASGMNDVSVESVWCFERQAQAIVGDLLERRQPLTSGLDALNDLHLIEAIWRSACRKDYLS